ncbi:MAG TPA: hypothetical protein VNO51_19195 [Ilumatobacteraceae bacterium]|nr:hypothetical protein [Ilumatobacteraceae bacterium]
MTELLRDRLVDLAAAEHLTIVIDSVFDDSQDGASDRIDQSLQRARLMPRTAVWDNLSPATRHVLQQPESRGVRFVVSDSEQAAGFMSSLRAQDLGVSMGRAVAGAALRVDAMEDLAELLETLVSTRSDTQAPDPSRSLSRSHGSPLLAWDARSARR